MLGGKSIYADECYKGNFIGADFGIVGDLTNDLFEDWRVFNHKYIPI
jgi:restriction system protein